MKNKHLIIFGILSWNFFVIDAMSERPADIVLIKKLNPKDANFEGKVFIANQPLEGKDALNRANLRRQAHNINDDFSKAGSYGKPAILDPLFNELSDKKFTDGEIYIVGDAKKGCLTCHFQGRVSNEEDLQPLGDSVNNLFERLAREHRVEPGLISIEIQSNE